ncbi:hypothetical protein MPG29_05495 [Helicobacter pylori]|nr:hypothetical protein MPG29_05495 [Helicobacter pylori]
MLLDYDFLLLLNDESGNPTRYYYLLQDFEKDFVAREVAQNRTKRFVKEIIGSEKASFYEGKGNQITAIIIIALAHAKDLNKHSDAEWSA